MSSDVPSALHPVMIVEDRYDGVYSGGRWWAVAQGDEPFEGQKRIVWLMANGPGSDDVTCAVFWARPPRWIAAGRTPEEALTNLVASPDADTDDWRAPRLQDDPRAGRWRRSNIGTD